MKRWILIVPLAAGIMIGSAANVTARQSGPSPFKGTIHTVQPGETLWEIAREAAPEEDPREMVARIKKANRMESSMVVPGQELKVPTP